MDKYYDVTKIRTDKYYETKMRTETCCRSILNFFELILKAYTRWVPNRTTIFEDWAHQSFICCPFYLLWDKRKDFVSGSRLALVQTLLTCIPLQIICDSDPNILDAFDIFEDRSIQSMDLFDPFPCYLHHIAFDRLKSHTQIPCPASQLIYIFLKFQCVLCIFNFSVTNSVISKES